MPFDGLMYIESDTEIVGNPMESVAVHRNGFIMKEKSKPKNNPTTELPVFPDLPCTISRPIRLPNHSTVSGANRKLVLHFDIRNTMIVADSVTNVDVEQALNSFLTGVAWGSKVGTGWEWLSDEPSITAPQPGAITYYKSLEKDLVRTPTDRARLRHATGDFTLKPVGQKFRPYFEKHLELLEWNYGLDRVDPMLTMTAERSQGRKAYHYILPSFVKLIYHLQEQGRRFSIVIRTYGMDAPNVLASIRHIVRGNHPEYSTAIPIQVNTVPGCISRSGPCPSSSRIHDQNVDIESQTIITCTVKPDPKLSNHALSTVSDQPDVVFETDLDIYRFLSGVEGVCGFVDDFDHWQRHGYSHFAGKPLWIDPTDPEVHHIFFDDNIRVTDSDSIVDIRVLDQLTARSLELDEISRYEDACLVQADLLQSTEHLDYFIQKVAQCEAKYSELVQAL